MSLYIDIHTHKDSPAPEGTIAVRSVLIKGARTELPAEFCSVGIHPWDALQAEKGWLDIFASGGGKLIAVGEIGLDYRKEYEPYEIQRDWFVKQVAIAEKLGLPVIIHNVRAQGDIVRELNGRSVKWVIHGFTGSPESAQVFIDAGGYISFGEGLFHSGRTAEAMQSIPPERIFLETDESDMAVTGIYSKAAEIIGIDEGELKDLIGDNFRKVFTRAAL